MPRVLALTAEASHLRIEWADGHRSTFHAIWLRDNCPCPSCRHESGQRLLDTVALSADVALASARGEDGAVEAVFADGHEARFEADWLRAHCYCADEGRRRRPPRLWGAELAAELPCARYEDVIASEDALRSWLASVDELGFALLLGGPTAAGTVACVVELFGFVRETNYGRVFDVRSVVDPSNLAFTGLALGPHSDNPYRDPTPTLQLLHCLASSAGGGENTVVDAFRVADDFRRERPDAFDLLARHPLRYRYSDGDAELEAEWPVLALDPHGAVSAVHFNTRSAAPLAFDESLVEPFYEAYLAFGRHLSASEYQLRFKLEPGDLFVVDNLRVLHGRTGYSEAGERHLQGCYSDRDGLRSRLAVLRRGLVDEIFHTFRERGGAQYLGEPVSMAEHMLQSADAAERDDAAPALVAAALLHDFGHLIHNLPEDSAAHGVDTRHEDVGHAFLARHFGPAVAEPVRLHVAAKRYLCAVEPEYLERLSPASLLSLELQGGPYDARAVAEFEASPYAADAVRLRRYDDAGKVAGLETPALEHYRRLLETTLA